MEEVKPNRQDKQHGKTDLSSFNNSWYSVGGPRLVQLIWYVVNALIFRSGLFPFYGLKVILLRLFGAVVGKGVVIKPGVSIKYPWKLQIGPHVWIGEGVWIDNLDLVTIESNCCLSQGSMLICGSHDYKRSSFDLTTKPIHLEAGVWIGARSTVALGVTCGSHSVLTLGSVATRDMEPHTIYQGNPAQPIRKRQISP